MPYVAGLGSEGRSCEQVEKHTAARCGTEGHLSVVKLLVERGADVTLENEDEQTPSELAWGVAQIAVAE